MKYTFYLTIYLTILFSFLITTYTFSQNEPLSLKLEGNLVIKETVDGKEVEILKPLPKEVKADEIINYTIKGENSSKKPLKAITVDGKIPAGTIFIEKTPKCNVKWETLFSIDGGKTYAKPPIMEKITKPDGTVEEKEVSIDRYTNIQFLIDQLKGEEEFICSYRVRVL